MKPESIKTILRSYLKEKQHSSNNDVPSLLCELPEHLPGYHGFSYTYEADSDGIPCISLAPEYVLGKPFHVAENRHDGLVAQSCSFRDESNDLAVMQHESADLPWDEHNVPFEPQVDELAVGVGRRLSEMSDDFDLNHIVTVTNQNANGNRCIQFKECVICVPATCDLVQIPIIRTTAADSVVNVTWRTCDRSAKAGFHYVDSQGIISFAQDDEEQTIEVQIIRDLDRRNDLHFSVELYDDEGIFNTLTVYIVDYSRLQPEEEQCIKNIFSRTRNISMSEIVTCLRGKVTCSTFKAALRCLCSNADTIPKELALGAELFRLTTQHPPVHVTLLTNVFCEYFSYLPDLEDIVHLF